MDSKTVKNRIFIALFALLLFAIGICWGNYQGYNRGYDDGQRVTNTWWIDKQSRYYDSVEVEKKRISQEYDLL